MNPNLCQCGRQIDGDRRQKRCTLCRSADPHRNRVHQMPEMIVSVDGEGEQQGTTMELVSISYGREDGTSKSLWVKGPNAGKRAVAWLVRELSGPYQAADGVTYAQALHSFHFTWDNSTISKDWSGDGLELVYASNSRPQDRDEYPIGTHNRYNAGLIQDVITDGGESGLMGLDVSTKLAISISPKRRFRAEYRPCGRYFKGNKRIDIHDSGSAFIGGLLKVIDDWRPELSDEQHKIIEWGKHHRKAGFLGGTPEQVMQYSEAECVAHARCVRLLLDAINDAAKITIRPSKLFGSGSIASQAFKFHRVLTRQQADAGESTVVCGSKISDLAHLTYFGGLIETPTLGLVEAVVDEVDINSAYPAQAIRLPCMRHGHGKWRKRRGEWLNDLPEGTVGHVQATWSVDTPSTPPFVVRTPEGQVRQPLSGYKVWVTLPEFQAAVEQFGSAVSCHYVVWWEQQCDCPNPLEWLDELYAARAAIKRQMKTVEKYSPAWWELNSHQEALKLIINSCYGKLAQQRPSPGKYANLHYASFITGATRAQVRRETWLREVQGGLVVYQHTDSVLSVGGAPADGGTALGAWKLEKQSLNMLVIQPGLAVSLGGLKIDRDEYGEVRVEVAGKIASRGAGKVALAVAAQEWAGGVDFTRHPTQWPELVIPRKMMISRRMALARSKPELAGAFIDQPLRVSFASAKRNIDGAVPVESIPTAWRVPPVQAVHAVATVEDLKLYRTSLARRIDAGEFDNMIAVPVLDHMEVHS